MINYQVFDTTAILYEKTAEYIVQLSKTAIKEDGRFSIALSGGSTPRKLYELLATDPYVKEIDWDKTFVFWSDERNVPFSDDQNNSHMAYKALLEKVPIPPQNCFRVLVDLGPAAAAADYERSVKTFFNGRTPSFDLILLGLGDNGHTASLFPFTDILNDKDHLVKEVYVKELGAYRISFTAGLINMARHILFLVSGKEKATMVNIVITHKPDPEKYPAQLITSANTRWHLDKDAATQLKNNQ